MTNYTVDLAYYRKISDYQPTVGDFVIYSGWFTVKYGIIIGHTETDIHVTIANTVSKLLKSQAKYTKVYSLNSIRTNWLSSWAIYNAKSTCWYT